MQTGAWHLPVLVVGRIVSGLGLGLQVSLFLKPSLSHLFISLKGGYCSVMAIRVCQSP